MTSIFAGLPGTFAGLPGHRLLAGLAALVVASTAMAAGPGDLPQQADPWFKAGAARLAEARARVPITGPARNIILFIGDGMGVTTVTAARILAGQQRGESGEENVLSFETFPYLALAKTYNTDMQTPDSAGTASAIMTGIKTRIGVINVNASVPRGDCPASLKGAAMTIAELAEEAGLSTGLVSGAPLTHATPATVYAHAPDRNWRTDSAMPKAALEAGCKDIAAQLIDFPYGDGIDVALGGGRNRFLPVAANAGGHHAGEPRALRRDGRDLTREWLDMRPGSAYVTDAAGLAALVPGRSAHVLGLFAPAGMLFEADRRRAPRGQPSLSTMTATAIDLLAARKTGFFLMVEGAEIDWAHHNSNAARALEETIELAKAVRVALEKTDRRDTLIIVTADHAHTLTFAGYSVRGNPILGLARGKDGIIKGTDGKPYTTLGYANGPGAFAADTPATRPDLSTVDTTNIDFRQQAAVPTGSETHGGDDVAVYSLGPMAHLLSGVVEQNYIFHVMEAAGNLRARAEKKGR